MPVVDRVHSRRGCSPLLLLGMLVLAVLLGAASRAATFTVINTNSAGPGSLAQAILDANGTPGSDRIEFAIPGPGVHTIIPLPALPTITDPVVIDGYTQPGSSVNTLADATNAVLLIELEESTAAPSDGLVISAGNSTVRGLVLDGFGGTNGAIVLTGGGSNVVEGNFLGPDPTGTAAPGNSTGVSIQNSAQNLVGGSTPAARNLIAGNGLGIDMQGSLSVQNRVEGNLIGSDRTGTQPLGNSGGVEIETGANTNTIGGTAAGTRNLISANEGDVVIIGTDVFGNLVQGNFIGTNVTGSQALSNGGGVLISNSPNNRIGGTAAGAGNLISGITGFGISIFGDGAAGTVIQGNRIGTNAAGTAAVPNTQGGILADSLNIQIGGAFTAARNLISGNNGPGVSFFADAPAVDGHQVLGNFIGTDVTGALPVPNGGNGVQSFNSTGNQIGAPDGGGNVIAFNTGIGVSISGGAVDNAVSANAIHSNGQLGIDLFTGSFGGVTPNDPGDPDTGPNQLQNFPVLTTATVLAAGMEVVGTLNSTPSTTFRVEIFSSQARDPSGFGEGQFFLGSVTVVTDSLGNGAFTALFPVVPGASFITATATSPSGSTSEFSAAIAATTPNADLSVTKTDSQDPSIVNQPLTYTLTVRNGGPDTATGVVLTDTLPAGVQFLASDPPPTTNVSGVLTFNLGTLTSGQSAFVSVTVRPTAPGTITNRASVQGRELDPNITNNAASESTVIRALTADLSITKTDDADPSIVNQPLTYTITVRNAGPDPATGVTVIDTLPPTAQFLVSTPPPTSNQGGVLTFALGTLASGGSSTISVTVVPSRPGVITNTATVQANESDPNIANNTASEDTLIRILQADLSITKTDDADPSIVNQPLTYTVTVRNAGGDPATNVVVTDTLPPTVQFQASTPPPTTAQGNTLTFALGTLASGATSTITVTVLPTQAGVITNTARVQGNESDPNPANNTASEDTLIRIRSADLTVTQTDSPDPGTRNQPVTYTIQVSNNAGGDPATGVTLTDALPAGTQFVSSTPPPTNNQGGVLTFALGNLASDDSTTVSVTVRPTQAGMITNTVQVQANESDPDTENNTDAETTLIRGVSADLAVAITDNPDPSVAFQPLTYTITVVNSGPDPATGVVLTETLPNGAQFLSSSPQPSGGSGDTLTFGLGTLAVNETRTVTLTVLPELEGVITNTAAVQGNETDPNPGNNTAAEDTFIGTTQPLTIANCTVTPRTLPTGGGLVTIDADVTSSVEVTSVVARFTRTGSTVVIDVPMNPIPGNPNHYRGSTTLVPDVPTRPLVYDVLILAEDENEDTAQEACGQVTVSAAGTGTLTVSTRRLAYGKICIGNFAVRHLVLGNTGTAPLTVTLGGPGGPFTVAGSRAFTLAPGAVRRVTVRFIPRAERTFAATLTITSSDPARPRVTVSVTGEGCRKTR